MKEPEVLETTFDWLCTLKPIMIAASPVALVDPYIVHASDDSSRRSFSAINGIKQGAEKDRGASEILLGGQRVVRLAVTPPSAISFSMNSVVLE